MFRESSLKVNVKGPLYKNVLNLLFRSWWTVLRQTGVSGYYSYGIIFTIQKAKMPSISSIASSSLPSDNSGSVLFYFLIAKLYLRFAECYKLSE